MQNQDHRRHLFEKGLKELYYVETHLVKALEELKDSSVREDIRESFDAHRQETQEQIKRLKEIFKMEDKSPQPETAQVLAGLIEDRKKIVREKHSPETIEFFNLNVAAMAERIEISLYEKMIFLAKSLGKDEAVSLLRSSLKEEERARRKVRSFAKWYDLTKLNEEGLVLRSS